MDIQSHSVHWTQSCSKALKSKQMQMSHWLIWSLISRGHTYRWGFYCRKIIQLVLTGCIKRWAKESLYFHRRFFQIAVVCVNATNSRRHFKAVGILHWCFCTMEIKSHFLQEHILEWRWLFYHGTLPMSFNCLFVPELHTHFSAVRYCRSSLPTSSSSHVTVLRLWVCC